MNTETTYNSYLDLTTATTNQNDVSINSPFYFYLISESGDFCAPVGTSFYLTRNDARAAKRLLSAANPGTNYYIMRSSDMTFTRIS